MLARPILLAALALGCGAGPDTDTPDVESVEPVCYRVTEPTHNPSCCRDPELNDWFNPPEPVCWEDLSLYEAYRIAHNEAELSGECKTVQHANDECAFNVADEPPQCRMSFDPDPELAEATERAAERWSAATGCDVRVEAGGIPVYVLPQIFIADDEQVVYTDDPNGDRRLVCGVTQHRWDIGAWAIHIATDMPQCNSIDEVLAHEIGHVFGPPATHAEEGLCADSSSPHRTPIISTSTLKWACAHTPCSAFVPEAL